MKKPPSYEYVVKQERQLGQLCYPLLEWVEWVGQVGRRLLGLGDPPEQDGSAVEVRPESAVVTRNHLLVWICRTVVFRENRATTKRTNLLALKPGAETVLV